MTLLPIKCKSVGEEREVLLVRGDKVTARWFYRPRLVGLAGTQMKVSAREVTVTGTVAHVRGNHLTEPTMVALFVTLDHELPEGMEEFHVPDCSCGTTHVLVNPDHVIDVQKTS